jgi:hypothetical protein
VTRDEITRSGMAAGMTTIIPIVGRRAELAGFGLLRPRPISANRLSCEGCMLEAC